MLSSEGFTKNEEIDNIQLRDATVNIVGFFSKVNNNFHSTKGAKFYKFVVDNNQGREVQVIAWNDNIKLLEKVQAMGTIVHISSAKASVIKNTFYNTGNVNFELIIKENSTVDIYGSFKEDDLTLIEEVTIREAVNKINHKIKVEGIMKTELNKYKNRDFEYTVGSITDCNYKLELKANFDCSSLKIPKGTSVTVIGFMEQFLPGPPILRIDKIQHINIIDRERISFVDVLQGYKNIKK